MCVFVVLLTLLQFTVNELAEARRTKKNPNLLDQLGARIDAAWVKTPIDEEVCFSPEEHCDIKLVKFIDSAKSSLDIAVFDITLDQVAHHILVQAKKIPVRMVVDRRQAKGNHSLVRTLIKGGISLKIGRQRGLMHNKFTIVDGKMVETGSFNYTNGASTSNSENQIYLEKPAIVSRYRNEFERLWANADSVN